MKAGDVITRINGKSARGVTLTQAVKKITGPEGTHVKLTIKSLDGEERELDLKREKIKVASLKGWERQPNGSWNYFIDPEQKIGYLRLTNFTKTSGDEMDGAIAQMKQQGAKGLILDLRYNPGGLLTAAAKVADKFLSDGVIVSTKTDPTRDTPSQPPIEATKSPDDLGPDFPVVVMVNQMSASASEIVSGALKDWNRATLVGERTFGKGSVQMLFPMPSRTAYLKLTTSHYYLPAGRCIHHEKNSTTWGVDPDVVVEMTRDQQIAANEARQDKDILGYGGEDPATQPVKKDVLAVDPQLNAGLLLLRMKVASANAQVAGK
jgi:carboxyl-terminal processing protease